MESSLDWIDDEAAKWTDLGLSRRLRTHGPARAGKLDREGRELVNFGSNNYLGLADDPRVIAAALAAAEREGWGAGASPLVTGWSESHHRLAAALAAFEHAEAVALFPSGFAANLGTIPTLVGPGDAVYQDRLNHACLIDGAKLSGARLRIYPHVDMNRLESILTRDRGRFRRALIATDGVFSMDGDLAPLADLADLADRFGAMLLVDEAHGTGVFGPNGRGAAAESGVAQRITIRMGTLSKALGSAGGFVAGSRRLIDWLINHARPLVYSTGLPPAAAAAAQRALELSIEEPWRRAHLFHLGRLLHEGLRHLGYATGNGVGPIVPIYIGPAQESLDLSQELEKQGFLAPAIRPPTVPAGTARLRLGLCASHTEEDITQFLEFMSRRTPSRE